MKVACCCGMRSWREVIPNRVLKALISLFDKLTIAIFAGGVLPIFSTSALGTRKAFVGIVLTLICGVVTISISYAVKEETN